MQEQSEARKRWVASTGAIHGRPSKQLPMHLKLLSDLARLDVLTPCGREEDPYGDLMIEELKGGMA